MRDDNDILMVCDTSHMFYDVSLYRNIVSQVIILTILIYLTLGEISIYSSARQKNAKN